MARSSGDKVQLGLINSTTNGINDNPGVAFESFRFIPGSATSWPVYEQYRTGDVLTTGSALGTVTVAAGHWYKFVVGVTNTSGVSGNVAAGLRALRLRRQRPDPGRQSHHVFDRVQSCRAGHSDQHGGLAGFARV